MNNILICHDCSQEIESDESEYISIKDGKQITRCCDCEWKNKGKLLGMKVGKQINKITAGV